jgi:hypothetical protein
MACTVASASLSCRAVGSSISAHRSMITLTHHTTSESYQHHCFISLRPHSHETHVGQERTHLAIQVLWCRRADSGLASLPSVLFRHICSNLLCHSLPQMGERPDRTVSLQHQAGCPCSTWRATRARQARYCTTCYRSAEHTVTSSLSCKERVIADPVSEEASVVCRLRPARHRDQLDMYHAEKVRYPCCPPIYMRAHSRTSLDHQSHAGYDLRTSRALSPCTTGHRGCCQASLAYS